MGSVKRQLKWEWKNILFVLLLIYVGFIVFYVKEIPHRETKFNNEKCIYIDKGWEYITASGKVKTLDAPFEAEPNKGDMLEISYYLPKETEGTANSFATWTGMLFMDVYLDDELIYEYGSESDYGKIEGRGWLILRLPENWEGKKLTLRVTSPYPEYVRQYNHFLLGTKAAILFEIVRLNGMQLVLAVVLIAMGIFLNIVYLFIRKLLSGEHGIAYLGWLQIIMGVWLFTESKLTQLVYGSILINDTLTYISMLMLPVPLLLYVLESMKAKKKIMIHIMLILHISNAVFILTLHTLGIRTMYEMLPISHALVAMSAATMLIIAIKESILYKNKALRFVGYSVIILTIGGIGELLAFYSGTRMYVGKFMQLSTIVCMVLITVVVFKKALSVVRISSEAVYYEKLALLDFMTQCQNRTSYQKELEKESKKVFDKENIAIILADLNNLKQMNDDLGHHIGDSAIKLCGKLILQVFRDYGKCYRVGGDEFACILSNCDEAMIKEMLAEFKNLCEQENKEWEYEFAVAIGYAIFDKKLDHCLDDTIKRADRSMYENKHLMKINAQKAAGV